MSLAKHFLPFLGASLWVWIHSKWLEYNPSFQGLAGNVVWAWILVTTILIYFGCQKASRQHYFKVEWHFVELPPKWSLEPSQNWSWQGGTDYPTLLTCAVGIVSVVYFWCVGHWHLALLALLGLPAAIKYFWTRSFWSYDGCGRVFQGPQLRAQLSQLRAVVVQKSALQVCLLGSEGQMLVCYRDQADKSRSHESVLQEVVRVAERLEQALGLPLIHQLAHYQVSRTGVHWKLLGATRRPLDVLATVSFAFLTFTPLIALLHILLLERFF